MSEMQRNIKTSDTDLAARDIESSSGLESGISDRKESTSNINEKLIDPKTLDWDDRFDKENPHNWSACKKWYTTIISALCCLIVSMGSSLYMTSVNGLVREYHVNRTLAIGGLTMYLLGLTMVIGAPLSEMYGRKLLYMVSVPISIIFSLGVAFSEGKMRIILPLRFFSGLFASPALSVAGGTIVDIFDFDQVSIAVTVFVLGTFLGPLVSPIIAGFAVEQNGWKWGIWIHLMAGGIILPFIALMPETYKLTILSKRAKKRGLNLKKRTKEENIQFLKDTVSKTVTRPLQMLVVEPIILVFSVYMAFVFAVLFAFFAAYPLIFGRVYSFKMGETGLTFLGILVGVWIGAFFYVWYDRTYYFPSPPKGTPLQANPITKRESPYRGHRDPDTGAIRMVSPEDFIFPMKIGAVVLPISLFWLGWSAKSSVHWIVPTLAGIPFGVGMILICFSTFMYFTASYPPTVVSSVFAANNLLRYSVCSVFPLFTVQMYTNLHISWAASVFGFISLAMLPVPWVFSKYGKSLRERSVFGYSALKRQLEAKASAKTQQDQ